MELPGLYNFPAIRLIFFLLAFFSFIIASAQTANELNPEYKKTLTERAAKIVNTIELKDSVKYHKVVGTIVDQYAALNKIQDESKETVKSIKAKSFSKDSTETFIKKEEELKSGRLLQLHSAFINQLRRDLDESQIEKVKDGMTYRILPVTWTAYQDMLPNLTIEQKNKIYGWLLEARELAMDEGSSERKHAVFGKYKGRINNYLSAAGYDMKKEGEDWQKRIKAREASKSSASN